MQRNITRVRILATLYSSTRSTVLNGGIKVFRQSVRDEREEEHRNLSTEIVTRGHVVKLAKANFGGKTALTEPCAITLRSVKVWYPEM